MWRGMRRSPQTNHNSGAWIDQVRVKALIGEYKELGQAISQATTLTFQIFSVGISVIAAATAVGLFRAERVVLLVVPISWALLALEAMRMHRLVLAMGAARADIERILIEECGQPVFLWETVVVPSIIHKRFFSWLENGLVLVVLCASEVAACWTADVLWQEKMMPLWGELGYDAVAGAILFVVVASLLRTIGTFRRTLHVIIRFRQDSVTSSSRTT
jgi:hypothetical protein